MKLNKYFTVQEFVPRETWQKWGKQSIRFVHPQLLGVVTLLRIKSGWSVIINDWDWGGSYNLSGYRPAFAYMPGGEFEDQPNSDSPHRRCMAADVKCFDDEKKQIAPKMVEQFIMNHEREFINEGLQVMESTELTKSWNHLAVENFRSDHILIVGGVRK